MNVLELENISKCYRVYRSEPLMTSAFLHWIKKKRPETFWALKDISFGAKRGESVGIIGENGAGKSTLLRILTGVTAQTSGTIMAEGRVGSLLELGAGFHPYLTGRENIFLNGTLLGIGRKAIQKAFYDITDFSGIGSFIDAPVFTYSDGMHLRLGFSVAVYMGADILVIDEVLAVGDEEFQHRCIEKAGALIKEGKTLIIVSHNLSLIRSMCGRTGWLSNGRLADMGPSDRITGRYLLDVGRRRGMAVTGGFPVTVVFQKGKLIIFWKGMELTKNLCGYTSIFSSGVWQDSAAAEWTVNTKGSKLRAEGIWPGIPVKQVWDIEAERDAVRWQIKINTASPVRIDNETVNLMLSENFTEWQMDGKRRQFPSEFPPGFWSRNISAEGRGETPSVSVFPKDTESDSLPKISFTAYGRKCPYTAAAANTDSSYRARVIQYERRKTGPLYLPGKDYIFTGIIRIG